MQVAGTEASTPLKRPMNVENMVPSQREPWARLTRARGSCPDVGEYPEDIELCFATEAFGRLPKVKGAKHSIGRHQLKRAQISATHCQIQLRLRDDGAPEVRLLDQSSNGTFVNTVSERIGKENTQPIKDGDVIYFYVSNNNKEEYLAYRLSVSEDVLTRDHVEQLLKPVGPAANRPQPNGAASQASDVSKASHRSQGMPQESRDAGAGGMLLEAVQAQQQQLMRDLEARAQASEERYQVASQQVADLQRDLAALKEAAAQAESRDALLEAQKAEAEAKCQQEVERLKASNARVAKLQEENKDATTKLAATESELATSKASVASLTSRVEDLESHVQSLTAEREKLRSFTEKGAQSTTSSFAQLNKAVQEKRTLAARLQALEEECETVKRDAESREKHVQYLESELAASRTAGRERTERIALLESRIDGLSGPALEGMEDEAHGLRLEAAEADVERLAKAKVRAEERVQQLTRDLEEERKNAFRAREEHAAKVRETEEQKEALEASAAEVAASKSKADALEEQKARVEARLRELEARHAETEARTSADSSEAARLRHVLQDIHSKNALRAQQLGVLRNIVSLMTKQTGEAQEAIAKSINMEGGGAPAATRSVDFADPDMPGSGQKRPREEFALTQQQHSDSPRSLDEERSSGVRDEGAAEEDDSETFAATLARTATEDGANQGTPAKKLRMAPIETADAGDMPEDEGKDDTTSAGERAVAMDGAAVEASSADASADASDNESAAVDGVAHSAPDAAADAAGDAAADAAAAAAAVVADAEIDAEADAGAEAEVEADAKAHAEADAQADGHAAAPSSADASPGADVVAEADAEADARANEDMDADDDGDEASEVFDVAEQAPAADSENQSSASADRDHNGLLADSHGTGASAGPAATEAAAAAAAAEKAMEEDEDLSMGGALA